jgi:myo-inositol 2-dehydrogenase/D-chiro-inositol 1-dehydrogenase
MVGIGIIGAGVMGTDHATISRRSVGGARLEMIADLDLARATAVADRLGCRATDDPAALISDASVDAVLVASHDATHPDFVRDCVAAGKPVLCEKPLSPSLGESTALLRDIRADAGLVSLGFMRRFDPGYVDLRAAVRERRVGAPVLVHAICRTVTSGPGSTTESIITNSLVHDLDIVPWLLGSPVTEASWQAGRRSGRVEGFQDPQLILLRTADGVLTTVEVFLNVGYGYDIRCEVVGESGTVSLAEPVRTFIDRGLQRSVAYAPDWRPRFADAYRLQMQGWVDSLSGGSGGPLASAHDGLVASAVAEAVITSMRTDGAWTPVETPEY